MTPHPPAVSSLRHRRSRRAALLPLAALLAAACGGPPAPATLDTANDQCGWCRMAVSSPRFAAQIVAPGEEPVFFDDLGCLRDYLASDAAKPRRAVAWVADHRSRAWVRAAVALYTLQPALDTPMGSHLIAHADRASRDADPAATGGRMLALADVFPAGPPPDGAP